MIRFLVLALALTGCTTKIVKTAELAQVKRVALIGLDVQQQKSVSKGDLLAIATRTASSPQATPMLRSEGAHLEGIYKDVAKKIEQRTGWKVIPLADLKRNAAYQKYFKDKTEGFQNRPMINDRYNLYGAPGVVDSFAVMTTKPERLKEIAADLKVDAVAYATFKVDLNNDSMLASMVGAGEFRPSASTSLFVLDGRTGEKLYMASANGPKVEKGERNTLGVANEDGLNRLTAQATGMATDLVIEDLKTKQ